MTFKLVGNSLWEVLTKFNVAAKPAREEIFPHRNLQMCPVCRHPDAAAWQPAPEIGDNHALGADDKPD